MKDSSSGFRGSPWRWLAGFGLVAVLAGIVVVAIRHPLAPDVAWFMSVARRVLDGEALYVDVIDVNPPLIVYLMMPPVLIADFAAMSDVSALNLYVAVLAFCSAVASLSLLAAEQDQRFNRGWWTALLAFVLLILPAYDFGQREHLLIVLTVPYVFLKWRRAVGLPVGTTLALTVGLGAGVGFAIKPFFVALWLGVEMASRLFRQGRDRYRMGPEVYGAAAALGLYAGYVILVHHEYLVMVRSIAGTYGDFGEDWRTVAALALLALLPAIPIALVTRGIRRSAFVLAAIFLVYGAIAALLAILQAKGWRYHFLPALAAVVVLAGLLLQEHLRDAVTANMPKERGVHVLALTAVVLGLALMAVESRAESARMASQQVLLERRVESLQAWEGSSILVLGETVFEAYPLLSHLDASSASPFPSMWWLRAIYANPVDHPTIHEPATMGPAEKWLHGLLVRRFVRDCPDLVLVDTSASKRFAGRPFPYIRYFGQNASFAEAWRDYQNAGSVDYLTMWVRTPASGDRQSSGLRDRSRVEGCAEGNVERRE